MHTEENEQRERIQRIFDRLAKKYDSAPAQRRISAEIRMKMAPATKAHLAFLIRSRSMASQRVVY
ncbi:MAG: hypothetical protein WC477_00520 [Patescibacteria group bacterium]